MVRREEVSLSRRFRDGRNFDGPVFYSRNNFNRILMRDIPLERYGSLNRRHVARSFNPRNIHIALSIGVGQASRVEHITPSGDMYGLRLIKVVEQVAPNSLLNYFLGMPPENSFPRILAIV